MVVLYTHDFGVEYTIEMELVSVVCSFYFSRADSSIDIVFILNELVASFGFNVLAAVRH
jgi:hypothetical protein